MSNNLDFGCKVTTFFKYGNSFQVLFLPCGVKITLFNNMHTFSMHNNEYQQETKMA